MHVAHAEDPRGHAVGMEVLELVELLADRDELHGPPGDRPHRQRSASARVSVELREDHAVERDALLERERDVHRLLPGHRVEHEEHVRRLRLGGDALELLHELLVDVQPARGVEDHDVERFLASGLDAEPRRVNRIGAVEREHGDLDLLAELLELVDRSRTLEIAGNERGTLPVAAQQECRASPPPSSCPSPGGLRGGSRSADGRTRAASPPSP